MSEVQIGDHYYRCLKMPTRIQFHVVKRLVPVLQGLAPLFTQSLTPTASGTYEPDVSGINIFEALSALTNTIGLMSDADADYVLDAALSAVQWRQGERWLPLKPPQGGALLLGAADNLDVQLRLLWEVLVESLGNFSLGTLLPQTQANGMDQRVAMVRE